MWRKTTDRKRVSPSASEPVSASLHKVSVAKHPDMPKPATCGGKTGCIRRTLRGERGERARKDASRNLGDPLWPGVRAGGLPGINNRDVCRRRESERPIVAKRPWKQSGAKGPCCEHAE